MLSTALRPLAVVQRFLGLPKYSPPVSSRTTTMSTPSITSGFSVVESTSMGRTFTGRRLAKRASSLRSASRPSSGRTLFRGSSHLGPPTAPSSTAWHLRHILSVAAVRASPEASMAIPPISPSWRLNSCPNRLPTASRTFSASATTSGPTPSPGKTAISNFILWLSFWSWPVSSWYAQSALRPRSAPA